MIQGCDWSTICIRNVRPPPPLQRRNFRQAASKKHEFHIEKTLENMDRLKIKRKYGQIKNKKTEVFIEFYGFIWVLNEIVWILHRIIRILHRL